MAKKVGNKKSEISAIEISKGGSTAINKSNVLYIEIINDTSYEAIVKERTAGSIRIPSGKERRLFSYPECPFDFFATVEFNAAAPKTDYITFLINSLGDVINLEEC